MADQWSQHFQPPQNQNFNNYQQQYPPQQQYPQQRPQQQYGPPHNGAYHAQFQPNAPAPPAQYAQPDPNSCYNCGSPDHWAQDCPEPRREVPVGQINRQNFARPPKRQKPNAPIITKYPVPPHAQSAYGPPYGYGPGPYSQPHYPPQQIPYGPPTPMSAQSPSQLQWQQSPQYQSYHQPYQHESHYQPVGPTQHSYPTPTAQTPGPFYGSRPPSHQSSPQGPPYHSAFYPPHPQSQQPQGFQVQTFTGASPSSMASPASAYPSNKYHEGNRRIPEHIQHGQQQLGRPGKSYSETPKPQTPTSFNTELEEDDLNKLDVPDMPPSSVFLTDQTILAGGSSIRLVERPLPANFVVADAISPFELSKHEDGGRCQSKYWGRGVSNDISQNIRNSSDWNDISMDPIFSKISSDSELILLEDLVSLYNPRRFHEEIQEVQNQNDEVLQEPSSPKIDCNTWDVMESLEHALSAGRRKQPESTSSTNSTVKDLSQPPRDTEETLAASGDTRATKAIGTQMGPNFSPSEEQQEEASLGHSSRSRSGSLSRHDTNNSNSNHGSSRSNSGVINDYQIREWKDSSKNQDYTNHKSDSPPDNILPGLMSHRSAEGFYPKRFEPPPPPPPPTTRRMSSTGVNHSPVSAGSNQGNHSSFSDHNTVNGTTNNRYTFDVHSTSPSKIRSDRSNARKREYDQRESSEENETPGRRQADDVTPKLKRRQPKVAEAYSRRW